MSFTRSEASRLSRRLFLPRPWITVQTSTIPGAGLGAFAGRDLNAGVLLGYYLGEPCSPDADGDYVLFVSGYNNAGQYVEKCVDAQDPAKSSWARFINGVKPGDGRVPNVKFAIRGRKIGVYTLRNIRRGEEFLVDYGPEYW